MATKSAAVCKAGHIVSMSVLDAAARREEDDSPRPRSQVWSPDVQFTPRGEPTRAVNAFCGRCGAPVITTCDGCSAAIARPKVLEGEEGPNPFCVGCGQPFPWATRQERIQKLTSLLDFEDGLSTSDRLIAAEQIAELSRLEEADEPETIARRVKVAQKIRELAPSAWKIGQPIWQTVISSEVQQGLQHLPH